jgi:phosphoribosylanthranilate isomerase
MKLKVCGMKYVENIQEVAALQPDYLGFIFYDKSKRNFEGIIPELSNSIKKTGVFVNASIDEVVSKINQYDLQAVQLHGDESVQFCKELRQAKLVSASHNENPNKVLNAVEIIKVFGIKESFNFDTLKPYVEVVDYFLFDTKGKERGGNGVVFDWGVLSDYPFSKPFFLSGGIGLEQLEEIHEIRKTSLPIYALDVNSKFELEAGLKSIENIKKFKSLLVKS